MSVAPPRACLASRSRPDPSRTWNTLSTPRTLLSIECNPPVVMIPTQSLGGYMLLFINALYRQGSVAANIAAEHVHKRSSCCLSAPQPGLGRVPSTQRSVWKSRPPQPYLLVLPQTRLSRARRGDRGEMKSLSGNSTPHRTPTRKPACRAMSCIPMTFAIYGSHMGHPLSL